MARARRDQRSSGDETRAKILAATQQTIVEEGIVGTSARAIASRGGFTQATIFYHFGGIDDLLIAVIDDISTERLDRYRERLDGASTLNELVTVGRDLYIDDRERGRTTVLGQVLAGATGDAELGGRLHELMRPWMDLIEATADRVLGSSPLSAMLSPSAISYAISSLFLGLEILGDLDPDEDGSEDLFDSLIGLAGLVDALSGNPPATDATT